MDEGALDHAVEPRGWFGVHLAIADEVRELLVQVADQALVQAANVDPACVQHRRRVAVVGERQKEMLERHQFVTPLVGERKRAVQRLL